MESISESLCTWLCGNWANSLAVETQFVAGVAMESTDPNTDLPQRIQAAGALRFYVVAEHLGGYNPPTTPPPPQVGIPQGVCQGGRANNFS